MPPLPEGHLLVTAQSLCKGHPDRLADIVAEAVVDACLTQDPETKIDCRVLLRGGLALLCGELNTKATVDFKVLVSQVLAEHGSADKEGAEAEQLDVIVRFGEQAPDVAEAVHGNFTKLPEELVASDQALIRASASNETPEGVPLADVLALKLCTKLEEICTEGLPLGPAGKAQITLQYKKGTQNELVPVRVHTVILCVDCAGGVEDPEALSRQLEEKVVKAVCPEKLMDKGTDVIVCLTPTIFTGGHGAGKFSWKEAAGPRGVGKDGTKPQRYLSCAARWIAKSLVTSGFCARCDVEIGSAFGQAQPSWISVDTLRTAKPGVKDEDLTELVRKTFDLRPGTLMSQLELKAPQFGKAVLSSAVGADPQPPWEIAKALQL